MAGLLLKLPTLLFNSPQLSDGTFSVPLDPGGYSVAFELTGYGFVTRSVIVTGGAIIDAGKVVLSKQLTSSSVHGRVLDASGAFIAGALVQVVGGSSVQSGSDGAYRIDGLAGTQWSIRVSATGYNSQTYAIQVSQPSDIAQDFQLSAVQANGIGMAPLSISPASAAANVDITASTTLTNAGASDFSGALLLLVTDASGKQVGTGSLYDSIGVPLGVVALAAGQSSGLIAKWNTGSFSPGSYTLTLRAVEAGSIDRDKPLGTLVVDRQGTFGITGTVHFTGTVTATPPVIRAGLNQQISLSATHTSMAPSSSPPIRP